MSDDWNSALMEQTIRSIWYGSDPKPERINISRQAAATALIGIAPKDEIEGMVAAQLVACHNATMECYRRAMLPGQTHRGLERQSQSREQALADLCGVAGNSQPASWQGPAEGHGRARPRP